MSLPPLLRQKLLDRFDELIKEAEALIEMTSPKSGNLVTLSAQGEALHFQRTTEWKTKCASLLVQVLPATHIHRKMADEFVSFNHRSSHSAAVGALRAIKDDLERGFLDGLEVEIEAEMAADYMGQAEGLLSEGKAGKYDHVPAAVLAGAILEKALRTLLGKNQPPILITKSDGEPKTLSPMIDDLKKACVFNEAKAKQLRTWAAIRNHAAHGEFDQFTRADVEQMIPGISNFLADYLS